MKPARPLVTAAGITGLAVVAGGVGIVLVLAAIGCAMQVSDLDPTLRAASSSGSTRSATSPPTPDDPAAVALLQRAARAATAVRYAGTTGGAGGETLEVINLPGVGTVVRPPGMAAMLAGAGQTTSLADAARQLGLLAQNYRVRLAPDHDGSVAGRLAVAVEAQRPDGTPAARFWLDRKVGLLLRRDLLGSGGEAISSTSFTTLQLEQRAPRHLPPIAAGEWGATLDTEQLTARRNAGCTCATGLPDGFALMVARVSPEASGDGASSVVQLLYSDGLAQVSLFEQRGQLDPAAEEVLKQKGFFPTTYQGVAVLERMLTSPSMHGEWVWQTSTSVVTLVGPSTPSAIVEQRVGDMVAAVCPPQPATAGDGPLDWIERGWHRVTGDVAQSWQHLPQSSAAARPPASAEFTAASQVGLVNLAA